MVCVPMVAEPLRLIVWVALGLAFRLLSVMASVPVKEPIAVGLELIRSVQEAPEASTAGEEDVSSCGQVELLPNVKLLLDRLGFRPAAGTAKLRSALPSLATITVCGLSLLVAPTGVLAKASEGSVA